MEGTLRGLDREMTQQEVVRALKRELKQAISQSYLSQIESGARPHLTNSTRMLLARFFKVHPGYLVDDPEGYHTELVSDVRSLEDQLDLWLIEGAERFRRDPGVRRALLSVAKHEDSRKCLLLLEAILENPGFGGPSLRGVAAGDRGSSTEASGMSWESFYFGCFLIGFFFSLIAVLSGSAHLHLHLPRGWHAPAGHGLARGRGRRIRRSISGPSRRFWPGSAAPATC